MASNPFFSGRIPPELYQKAVNHCEETGDSKTDLLVKALSAYLEFPVELPGKIPSASTPEVTKEMFDKLQLQVNYLEKLLEKTINPVINSNNFDNNKEEINDSDNSLEDNDNSDNNNQENELSQIHPPEEDTENLASKESSLKGKLLEINEIPLLPGLEKLDFKKLVTKIRNAKAQERLPIKIENYLIGEGGKKPGTKRGLLWEVIDDNV